MPNKETESQLRKPFVEFDYTDPEKKDVTFREGLLNMVRLQKVFGKIGTLELTPAVVNFVRDPYIRQDLQDVLKKTTKFDLASPELPFLFRGELVDAYFQQRISEYLEAQDNIEIYLPEWLREKIKQPVGAEVRKQIELLKKRNLPEEKAIALVQAIEQGRIADIYDAVFDGNFDNISSITDALSQQLSMAASEHGLTIHPSEKLTADQLGGKDFINARLQLSAARGRREMTQKEEAIHYDRVRFIFQGKNGEMPEVEEHGRIIFSGETYGELSPQERKYIHEYLMSNLMDAQKIAEVQALFPDEIPANIAQHAQMGLFRGKSEMGVTTLGLPDDLDDLEENEDDFDIRHIFDADTSKDLRLVAMGAQNLLDAFRSHAKTTALALQGNTSFSDNERDGR